VAKFQGVEHFYATQIINPRYGRL